jgi:hypothetical protein
LDFLLKRTGAGEGEGGEGGDLFGGLKKKEKRSTKPKIV